MTNFIRIITIIALITIAFSVKFWLGFFIMLCISMYLLKVLDERDDYAKDWKSLADERAQKIIEIIKKDN